jgi:hypothetical protein
MIMCAIIGLTSCEELCFDATGTETTRQQIVVGGYRSIKNMNEGDVIYTQGDTLLVMVSADDRLFQTILVQNVDSNLVLDIDEDCLKNVDKMQFNITTPTFTGIDNRGEGSFSATDTVVSTHMAIDNSGAGNIDFQRLIISSSNVNVSSTGSVYLAGPDTTDQININCSRSGGVEAAGFVTRAVTVNVSGSGSVKIHATETLNVNITGSGNVYYKGQPVITSTITGTGQVIDQN